MKRSRWLPDRSGGNATGNIPRVRPLGKFVALLPMLPIALLEGMNKEKKDSRTRKYVYTRVKSSNLFGNGNRKQRMLP